MILEHDIELKKTMYFNNRELSWLAFNKRVLEEAIDERNPLLERMKFLAIFSSNLDEFFMVRVAGLKDQVRAGLTKPENKSGLTPKEQLAKISSINHELVRTQYETFKHKLIPLLTKEDIHFLTLDELSQESFQWLEHYFDDVVFPVLTPLAIDAYRPFPMLSNRSINQAIVLSDPNEELFSQKKLAIIQIPRGLDRYIKIPVNGRYFYILLDDLISHFSYKLFHGLHVESVTQFRLTRNADLDIHEEGARDLLKEIEEELKKRKWGATVRLEVQMDNMDQKILHYLLNELEIHSDDVDIVDGPLDLTFLFKFYSEIALTKEHLTFNTLIPQPPRDLHIDMDEQSQKIYQIAEKRDILFHHPYESFEPVIDFLTWAAEDPDVLAIKQTLYRVSDDSPVINSLKNAAENGKQVLVLVELKARFDEEHNVQWAKELEKSGCHVIYGMTYLKTHSKITLIVRKNKDKIQRFVHLGTGNYNEETAKIYTDMGLITSNPEFGVDATHFFNYLSGCMEKPTFKHFSVAPSNIRDDLIHLIDKEIEYHKQYGNGRMIAKMNSLTEIQLIIKLYQASRAGVKIDLIVRGICCLRPGIKDVSENIRVRSIVGRFLEHSRIFYFHHHGEEKIFLSSADLMTRNMEKRIEISFPIYDDELKERIKHILVVLLKDNVKAREQDEHGNYHYVAKTNDEQDIDSQLILYNMSYHVADDEE